MSAPEPPLGDDFRDLLVAFVDGGVEFILVGGWALALHGHARGTDDMDVFVRPTRDNAQRVFTALTKFGAPVAAHGVTVELFERAGYGYRMGLRPNLIEVLTSIDGVTTTRSSDACSGWSGCSTGTWCAAERRYAGC